MWKRLAILTLVVIAIVFVACQQEETQEEVVNIRKAELSVSSPAFDDRGVIPAKYTCQGEDINPRLKIGDVPDEAKSLVLIVTDPDAPMGEWVHWVVWNIDISGNIDEGSVPGMQGKNDFGKMDYGGPCPPSGTHRYFFKAYALDKELDLEEGASKEEVENKMFDHVIAHGELYGLYKKS